MFKQLYTIVVVVFYSALYAGDQALMEHVYRRFNMPLITDSYRRKSQRLDTINATPEGMEMFSNTATCCCCQAQRLNNLRRYYCQRRRPAIERYARESSYPADFMPRFDAYTQQMLNRYTFEEPCMQENPCVSRLYNTAIIAAAYVLDFARDPVSECDIVSMSCCSAVSIMALLGARFYAIAYRL
jgi:hypothetical protein